MHINYDRMPDESNQLNSRSLRFLFDFGILFDLIIIQNILVDIKPSVHQRNQLDFELILENPSSIILTSIVSTLNTSVFTVITVVIYQSYSSMAARK